ncbi:hypothetical protein [Ghiorsea bivora]|uniref:hypothetical protein n=1 Tax=Ghiorsea bivora TaxID=1485545 RepID=UPI0005705551|nr:hypothetical protein [Ghiorsea bivora]
MSKLSSTPTYYIRRSAFQSILHQALTQQEGQAFFGLLGSITEQTNTLDKVMGLTSIQQVETALQQWQSDGIVCVGVFLMQGAVLCDTIYKHMPNPYVHLSVKLDEKGRLDLLADLCDQTKHKQSVLPLSLIEDGQQVSYA